jgi:hypothetical protein
LDILLLPVVLTARDRNQHELTLDYDVAPDAVWTRTLWTGGAALALLFMRRRGRRPQPTRQAVLRPTVWGLCDEVSSCNG